MKNKENKPLDKEYFGEKYKKIFEEALASTKYMPEQIDELNKWTTSQIPRILEELEIYKEFYEDCRRVPRSGNTSTSITEFLYHVMMAEEKLKNLIPVNVDINSGTIKI